MIFKTDSQDRTKSDPSHPRPELVRALNEYATTPLDQRILDYAIVNNIQQKFVYDPLMKDPAETRSSVIYYNPEALKISRQEQAISGDERDTATLATVIAHEVGHTALGRAALGLTVIRYPKESFEPGKDIVIQMGPPWGEEIRAVRLFENPVRRSLGLPLRRSYFKPNDVLTGRAVR